MILLISTCKEKLHELEFVKPIEQILEKSKRKFKTIHYSEISPKGISSSDKIIICGTSLQDNEFMNHLDKFKFIKITNKPVLGICAGMQIVGLIFGGKIQKNKIIGLDFENFTHEFSNKFFREAETLQQVYNLHNNSVTLPKNFIKLNTQLTQISAFKHKSKNIYGVLFHPEVRNKELIKNFINI